MQSCDRSTLSDSNGAKITSELTNKPWSSQKSNVFAVLSLGSFSTLFRWNTYFHSSHFPSACRFHLKTPKQMFVLADPANSSSPKGLLGLDVVLVWAPLDGKC